jgi:cell division septation protein DedD
MNDLPTEQTFASGQTKVYDINFDHLPGNLLDNGWVRAYPANTDVRPKATVASDVPISGSIVIDAPDGHAYDYLLPTTVRLSDRLVFAAKYTPTTMIFTRVDLSSKDGTQQMSKWIKYVPRKGSPHPTKGCEDYEYTFPILGEPLQNEWRKFDIALPEVVDQTWGKHGLIFRDVTVFRLRGSLGISPIAFYESHTRRDSNLPPKFRLPLGDSIGVVGLLIGVFLVIIVPPLMLKIFLFVGVCAGVFVFSRYSHWTHGWTKFKRRTVASIIAVALCIVAIPQFVSQWRTEHARKTEEPTSPRLEKPPVEEPPRETPTVKPIPPAKPLKAPEIATRPADKRPSRSNSSSGTDSPSIGSITQGAGSALSINQQGGITAGTLNLGPSARRLPDDRTAFISCLQSKPGRFSIGAMQNNQEAYNYAKDWRGVLVAAGWEIEHKDIPIQIFDIGGGMWSGVQIKVHATTPGSTEIADNSPEKQFYRCITTIPLGAAGTFIPYSEIPTGVVRIYVSSHP